MSLQYRAVGWNRNKQRYDVTLVGGVFAYLALFIGVGAALDPNVTIETHLIRAFGTAAFLLLHVILLIGPLCRLDPRLLPLLYNRRHLGVTMFVLALLHGGLSILQFHAFGDTHPLVSLLTSRPALFQPLGFVALLVLFLMAATSHDFWLANLGAPAWKALHMLVYVAYALLVLHVGFGALQSQTSPVLGGLVGLGLALVLGAQLVAGWRERAVDTEDAPVRDGWVDVCAVGEIPEKRARIVTVSGDRVAVFRYDGRVAAVSNACQHQNGPLGEGRIVDGCITCPWHGYQYLPECGRSPEPFIEKIPTFAVRVDGGRVFVEATPRPPGTATDPAHVTDEAVPS